MPSPDCWRPAASLETLRRRAQLLADIRAFFGTRGVLEVDTDLLGPAPSSDPQQHCLDVTLPGGARRYLQPSPEYAMKRLLAAGSGSIYQVSKAFRAGEQGPRHRTEFTLVEWYRLGFGYRALMGEVGRAGVRTAGPAAGAGVQLWRAAQRPRWTRSAGGNR